MNRLLPLLLLLSLPALAEEPWSVDERHPVFSAPAPKAKRVPLAARPLRAALRFYQRRISPHDGPRCLLYPTCSEYARQALAKHGALLGSFLTADRLMQEYEVLTRAPTVFVHGHSRGWDPVEFEDFWWAKGPLPAPPRGERTRTFLDPVDLRWRSVGGRKRRLP